MVSVPFIVNVDIQVISFFHDQTCGGEVFAAAGDVDSRLPALRVFRAAGEVPPGDVFVDAFLVAGQIVGVCCGMDGRMGFIVIFAPSWSIVASLR